MSLSLLPTRIDRRRVAVVLGLLSSGAGAYAQPTFPSRVEEVRIFVRAETRGLPRLDLGLEDFEVREDGHRVANIRLIRLRDNTRPGLTTDGVDSADLDLSTGMAIVADDYLPVEEQVDYLREHLRDFVQGLDGNRFVSLVAPASAVLVEASLPNGLGTLNAALDRLHSSDEVRRVFFPSSTSPPSPAEVLGLELSMQSARLAAIQAAGASLAGVEGDRVVVLVAARSFAYGAQSGRDMYEQMLEAVRSANARLISVDYVPATTRAPVRPLTTQSAPENPTTGMGRRPVPGRRSFFSDPRASVPLDLSHAVATDTGGYSTRATLATALSELAAKIETQYLITYERTRPADGQFHKLEVKVKKRDIQLTHRRGFMAR